MDTLQKDLVNVLNKVQILFWEWELDSETVSFYTDLSDEKNNLSLKPQMFKAEFLNLFESNFRAEISKIFLEYSKGERKSHKLLCEVGIIPNKICTVLNLGYTSLDKSKVRGVFVRIPSDYDDKNYVEELKRILTHISAYTQEEFWIRDLDFNYIFISKHYSDIFEYSSEELLNTPIEKIFTPESIYYIKHNIEEELKFINNRNASSDKSFLFTLKGYNKSGKQIWTENSINFIRDSYDNVVALWGITRDITTRIKTDQIKEALYRISEYSHLTDDLNEFFAEIHTVVKAIMPATNFAISLYDKENNFISFPYQEDASQNKIGVNNFSFKIVEYLVKTEKAIFFDKFSIKKFIEEQKLESINVYPTSLIGLPIKIKDSIKGALIVYTYSESEKLNAEDFESLKFVADQISLVIERKINETEKQKIKSLFEAVSKAQTILLTKRDAYLSIQLAFEQIGSILNVSRISLYENINDGLSSSTTAKLLVEWIARNEYESGKIETIVFHPNLSRWFNNFYLGNIINEKLNSIPLSEYEILKQSKAKSILCIPIFLTKRLWGFIKFDDCKNERLWAENEISVLSVIAASIGGLFQRKIAEETLKTSEEKYRNFINNSMEGISLLQFTEPIDITLPVEEQIDKIYETGFIAEANAALANMYGLSSTKDIVGKTLVEIHGGSDNQVNREAIKKFILNGYKVINVETIEKKVDGTDIIILNNSIGIIKENKLKAIWGSQIDITERKKFELELKLAKEKAEEANRVKSNFLSNMSHELRTPLIGVLGYAEILMEEFKDTEYAEMAGIIFQSGNRLLETLNSILTISKIESEKFAVNYSKFDLQDVVREVVETFQPTAIKKNILITTEFSHDTMWIYSDIKIIREILNNLVNNAVKYTPSGSVLIKAFINFEENKLFLSVTDTGIGIPEDKLDIIFEEFRQASEGLSRSFEGVGLGLAICKKYVNILKGHISVKSKVNEGSTFIVEIPLLNVQ